jgi:environmental stress-induced protein Ves
MSETTIIRARDGRTMAWKNGGGTTLEILREPGDPPALRVSIADINEDGPFSRFPDVDRVILLLEGAGFTLDFDAHPVTLDTPFIPFHFDGESPCHCRLIDGPVKDLNVMVDRRTHGIKSEVVSDLHLPAITAPNRQILVALSDTSVCLDDVSHPLERGDVVLYQGPLTLSGIALLLTLEPAAQAL